MKRTVQMARAGIPKLSTPERAFKPRVMSSTLGITPIVLRSLRSIGGQRPSCRYTKKMNNKARRAGYPDAATMAATLAKFAVPL